jgi:hypothetical protein
VLATSALILDMATTTRQAVKVAIPVPPVVAMVMKVVGMTVDVLQTRALILDTAATMHLRVKVAIPEPPVMAVVATVTVVMTVAAVMKVAGMTTDTAPAKSFALTCIL